MAEHITGRVAIVAIATIIVAITAGVTHVNAIHAARDVTCHTRTN